jgi:alpha-L-fucosidase 2
MSPETVKITALSLLLISSLSCNTHKREDYNQKLWYTYPAKYWNSQSLHLGNGYIGASFFGGTGEEVIALTEKSMWTGGPFNGNWEEMGINPRCRESLPEIRKAITEGRIREADSLVQHNFLGENRNFGNFTSIGELIIKFSDSAGEAEDYHRELDLSSSVGRVHYRIGPTEYNREYFCSYPGRVLCMKFDASTDQSVSFSLKMNIMQDSSVINIHENYYEVKGFIDGNNRPFNVLIYVDSKGGKVYNANSLLYVDSAESVVIYLTTATNYRLHYPDYTGEEPEYITSGIMEKALNQEYEELKEMHICDYKSLFDRVELHLEGDPEAEKLPTDKRWQRLKNGKSDPGLKVLAFNLGRYLIISSSRPGTLPANLQGVWNNFKRAPWAGNYQSNINMQEIYMSCGPVNLPECQEPYIDWINDLSIAGSQIAEKCYGTNGWVSHTTGNIWGHAAPVGDIMWGTYPLGAAWHCKHVWEQYAFTADTGYLLKTGYPLLKGASVFWLENLIPYNGYLISAPTVSAEHGALLTENGYNPAYHDFESDMYRYCLPGAFQDIEMIWDLFTDTYSAAIIAGDAEFADSLLAFREKLLPLMTGKYGQLQEWYDDIDNPDCHHRHIAHMYAVYPGTQIHPTTTPALADAAKKSLDMRGDGRFPGQEQVSGGNWARAYRIWCWTRLMEGNRANKIFTEMLTEQGFENLLTYQHIGYHWERPDFFNEEDSLFCHFQLDASASVPGFMAEMLLQSHLDEIHLLPALPDEFASGKVSGLKARGGYTVDIEWKDGDLINAVITCPAGTVIPGIRIKTNTADSSKDKRIKIIKAENRSR